MLGVTSQHPPQLSVVVCIAVTAATLTLQQRKHLLQLLRNPDNAALLETLYTLRGLFGADITAGELVLLDCPDAWAVPSFLNCPVAVKSSK